MALLKSFANRPPRRAATEFDSRTLLKPLFIAHIKNSRQAGLSNWVRDINVTLGVGSFFVACILTYVIRSEGGGPPMSQSLDVLENQRAELIRQIAQLGDFRPGSITGIS